MASRVPPRETTTRLPAKSCWAIAAAHSGAVMRRSTNSAISSGSGRRPGPESRPVRRPEAGSLTTMPWRRRVATLSTVAALCHIPVCIAGASSTGADVARIVVVRRSSAWPLAIRAMRSAVAGATTTMSARSAKRTCSTLATSSNTSVWTGCPLSASHVGRPTNSRAALVGTTWTSWPASERSRKSRHAL